MISAKFYNEETRKFTKVDQGYRPIVSSRSTCVATKFTLLLIESVKITLNVPKLMCLTTVIVIFSLYLKIEQNVGRKSLRSK